MLDPPNWAEGWLADITRPTLVVMGEQDPDFPDPFAEATWIAQALHAQVVIVPEAHPQSQRPDLTTDAVLKFHDVHNYDSADGLA